MEETCCRVGEDPGRGSHKQIIQATQQLVEEVFDDSHPARNILFAYTTIHRLVDQRVHVMFTFTAAVVYLTKVKST